MIKSKLPELINLCLEKNIPFVSFRLPGGNKIQTWVQLSGKMIFVDSILEIINKKGFVYGPFHRNTNFPIVFFEPEIIIKDDKIEESFLEEIIKKIPLSPELNVTDIAETNQADYIKQAQKFIDSFNTSFKKAVLSRIHFAEKKDFNAGKFFINLQETYPHALCHLINIPGVGTWAGASPEMLISIDPKTIQTVSLAGTQQNNDRNKPVVWQEKEIEEQQIVSDYIESLLKKFEINSYVKEKTQTVEAGNTLHLATRYRFKTSELQNKTGNFIEELHPTPAVCGVPKEKALDMIFNTENHNREYYAGFLGTVNINSRTDLFVNLRCMKILPDKLALIAGGGLTKKSIPEDEWEETVLKAQTLLNLLKCF